MSAVEQAELSGDGRGRVWSLWEIVMRQFRIHSLLTAAVIGGVAQGRIDLNRRSPLSPEHLLVDQETISGYVAFYEFLEEDCVELELVASLATVRKILGILAREAPSHSDLHPLEFELRGRLIDETRGKKIWTLTVRESEYYNAPRRGWEDIQGCSTLAYDLN